MSIWEHVIWSGVIGFVLSMSWVKIVEPASADSSIHTWRVIVVTIVASFAGGFSHLVFGGGALLTAFTSAFVFLAIGELAIWGARRNQKKV
ncbi:MAG: hypothetical protein AAB840_01055 [Patescibacteria group bacterium]